jgi:hypothetical protein
MGHLDNDGVGGLSADAHRICVDAYYASQGTVDEPENHHGRL